MILVTVNRKHDVGEYAETEIFSDEEYLKALYHIGSRQIEPDFVSANLILRSDQKDSDLIVVDEYFAMDATPSWLQILKQKLGAGRMSRRPVRGKAP
jgi:hypothetical protein